MFRWFKSDQSLRLRIREQNAAGDFARSVADAAYLSSRTGERDDIIEFAVATHLAGDTAEANRILRSAREQDASYFSDLKTQHEATALDLADALASGRVEREFNKYTDDFIRQYWLTSMRDFGKADPRKVAFGLVYKIITERFGDFIATHRPSAVVDFGCGCGLPLDGFAARFPSIAFAGVDREPIMKELNQEAFLRANLTFTDEHIFDVLETFRPDEGDKMLMHVRTASTVYPAFLERLYSAAASNGFRYIMLYEVGSLSTVSFLFRDQGSGFGSESHRGTTFVHDYESALRRAGYKNVAVGRMPQGHSLEKNNMLPGDTYLLVRGQAF